MEVTSTAIPEVLILEPRKFEDERGFFFESFNEREFASLTGVQGLRFVQDNHSKSARSVVRGLHYQIHQPQGKLVRVINGCVYDVAVDLRRKSPTFGRSVGVALSAENRRQLWIPAGFAHGFVVTSEAAEFLYKTTEYWAKEYERCIVWNDPDLGIDWPFDGDPLLSDKDRNGVPFRAAQVFE